MPSPQQMGRARRTRNDEGRNPVPRDLPVDLPELLRRMEASSSQQDVLEALYYAAHTSCSSLSVLGAVRLPLKPDDWGAMLPGKSVFLHPNVPEGWWDEHAALAPKRFTPAMFLARSSLANYTWTETLRLLQPLGVDRWAFELALKYGMRDGFICPVGGRWMIAYWSKRDLSNLLTPALRILLQSASSFAALRLEHLTAPDSTRMGSRVRLTARELAVLRHVSNGRQSSEIAQELGLGEETVRSHLKKAQMKLGVHNRAHAACEALRQNLIP